ncbi:MAG: energy transducer TonB [Bacteroidaceae bacterium]|nr:energy transducer TonB [Bacteroidaceae bacterium]
MKLYRNMIGRLKYIVALIVFGGMSLTGSAQIFEFRVPYGDSYSERRDNVREEPVEGPKYKGGTDALNDYLKRTFKVPVPTDNVDGYITVACMLNEKGKVSEVNLVRGLTKVLNDEALRVAKKLKFKPARRGKKKIKSRFDVTFPIRRGRVNFSTLETIDV